MKRLTLLIAILVSTLAATLSAQQLFPEEGTIPQTAIQPSELNDLEPITPEPPAVVGGQNATSVNSGNWNDPATWDCLCVPNGDFDITIATGTNVAITENVTLVNLAIETSATLSASPMNAVVLNVAGDWSCEGNFVRGMSEVKLTGEAIQQINGTSNFHTLKVNGSGNVVLNGPVDIYNYVDIGETTFTTNNFLALRSTGTSKTGAIAPIHGGTLNGRITFERALSSSANGWLTIGAPVVDATVQDINNNFLTTGFAGANFPNNSFVSVQTYFEPAGTGQPSFSPVQSTEDAMHPGVGFYVYANAGNYMFEVSGNPVTSLFNFDVSFTDNEMPSQDGLNVLANPFPADINWANEEVWVKQEMLNAIYVWDVSLNRFRTYSNGYGTNGGSPIIRAGEAFWVKANSASPILRTTEQAKHIGTAPAVNAGDQFLKLRLVGLGHPDELIIALHEEATEEFDFDLDALKLTSAANVNLACRTTDNLLAAIKHIPNTVAGLELPIAISANNAGSGSLILENIPQLHDRCMWIEDLETGDIYPLESTESIEFDIEQTTMADRFLLHMTPAVQAEPTHVTCMGENSGEIDLQGIEGGPWTFTVRDAEDLLVGLLEDYTENVTLAGLPAGSYNVTVEGNGLCGTLSTAVTITEPESHVSTAAEASHIGCNEHNSGAITVDVTGGVAPYTYEWNDGFETPNRVDIAAGTYTLTVTDANECTATETVEIEAAPTVSAAIEVDQQVVTLENGQATINFTFVGENATDFLWNFGDNSTSSTEANPSHTYTEPGNYVVSVYAANDQCADSYQMIVIVEMGVNIEERNAQGTVTAFYANGVTFVRFSHSDLRKYRIDVHNLLGQQVMAPLEGRFGNQQIRLNMRQDVPAFIVTVRDLTNGKVYTTKIIR